MRIGIQTKSLDPKGYGRWGDNTYKKLKEHGYSCSDFEMANTESILYTASEDETDAIFLREKEMAAEARIEIIQVHGPWRYPPKDFSEEDRAERMEKMKKSIRAASLLGSPNWVVHPLMPFGIEDINTENEQKTWDINFAFMSELLKTAKEYGVTICLENMPFHKFSLSTPDAVLKLVKAIDDENFKICLDTGHVAVFDNLSVGDEVRKLKYEIRALHVHDNKCGLDLHLLPYEGIIDWDDFAAALKEINFKGCFSLETGARGELDDDLYEDMCKVICKIAQRICRE